MTDSTDQHRTQRPTSQKRATPPSETPIKTASYETTDYLPPNPAVTLLFEGLLWFMYHGKEECQVGIHNSTKTYWPHAHHHELQITVWDRNTCTPIGAPYSFPKTKEITGIQIDVNNPVKEGVYVYEKGRHFPRPDTQNQNDPEDWRWLVDFEYYPLYTEGIKLDPDDINPGVWINHGTFFTLVKTSYDFDLRSTSGGEVHHLGNIGLIAGGAIDLKPGGSVTLTIRKPYPQQSVIIPLSWTDTNKRYQIDIRNACMRNGVRCKPEDYGSNGNDFYLYNDTFKRPPGRRKFILRRVQRRGTLDIQYTDRARRLCLQQDAKEHMASSNEAPCGPVCAGLGGT